MVATSDEMEVSSGNQLNIQLEKEGNIEIAGDCQIEFAYRQSLIFEPFKVIFLAIFHEHFSKSLIF